MTRSAKASPSGRVRGASEQAAVSREALVARLWRAAERQVSAVERRIDTDKGEDRNAHSLAVLVKTLRELSALDAAAGRGGASEDDDAGPRDIEEFRNELAREIEAFVASRTDG